jgi:hypothetical protein
MAFSNYRTIALMVFFSIAVAASRVEAEVIRQELTVSENENEIALTRYAAEERTGPRPTSWSIRMRGTVFRPGKSLRLATRLAAQSLSSEPSSLANSP